MNIDKQEQTKSSSVQVISRAAKILRALREHPKGLSLSQIAKEVGLARSTVQRIVTALEEERYVATASTNGGFRLGPEIAMLATAVHSDLREEIRPFLIQLSHQVNETVDLSVLDNGKVLLSIKLLPRIHYKQLHNLVHLFHYIAPQTERPFWLHCLLLTWKN